MSRSHTGVRRSASFIEKARARSQTGIGKAQWSVARLKSQEPEALEKKSKSLRAKGEFFAAFAVAYHTGRKRSAETRRKLRLAAANNRPWRQAWKQAWWDRQSQATKMRIARAARLAKPTSIEIATRSFLTSKRVSFTYEVPIGPYLIDIYLPSRRLAIECDGDYWHSLPGVADKDAAKDAFLCAKGIRVVRLSESEIRRSDFAKLEAALC